MGGGPGRIRTAGPVTVKTSLKCRQNFAGESAKCSTEKKLPHELWASPMHTLAAILRLRVPEPDLQEKP
jgi:hypothetical protein